MSWRSWPRSTTCAVSSRKPPNRINASARETGARPARWNPGLSVSTTSMSVSCSIASRCNGWAAAPRAGASRIQLSVIGGPPGDVVDVCADGATDLGVPLRIGIDGGLDRGDQCFVVGPQQLDEAFFLACEFAVEGALGGLGVADDVGDRGVPVAAFGDRLGEAVEQPVAERARGVGRGCVGHNGRHLVASEPLRTCGTAMYRTAHAVGTSAYHDRGWRFSMTDVAHRRSIPRPADSAGQPSAQVRASRNSSKGRATPCRGSGSSTRLRAKHGDVFSARPAGVRHGPSIVADPLLAKQLFTANTDDVGNIQPNLEPGPRPRLGVRARRSGPQAPPPAAHPAVPRQEHQELRDDLRGGDAAGSGELA